MTDSNVKVPAPEKVLVSGKRPPCPFYAKRKFKTPLQQYRDNLAPKPTRRSVMDGLNYKPIRKVKRETKKELKKYTKGEDAKADEKNKAANKLKNQNKVPTPHARYFGLKKHVQRLPHATSAEVKKTAMKLAPDFKIAKRGGMRELEKVCERMSKKPSKRSGEMNVLKRRGRLYAKATFTGYKRGLRNQYTHTALLNIDGCRTTKDTSFYVGKKCVFMYKCKNGATTCRGFKTKVRVVWGKVTRTHGNTSAVRAKFAKNLPPRAMGCRVRIMLYPSTT